MNCSSDGFGHSGSYFENGPSLSRLYDYGRESALMGLDFEGRAEQIALGATCSDKFLERFEALERGYAEGMRLALIVENLEGRN